MATVLILGAGISGNTAALVARRKLGKQHRVIVVSPSKLYQWIPSNIWVGIGKMNRKQVTFDVSKVYQKQHIDFVQALAKEIHPEGNQTHSKPFVVVASTASETFGSMEEIEYDYLINATGPKLNFEATPGLGPKKFTNSVCSFDHAEESWKNLQESIQKMERGETQRFVFGTGHGRATCQGAGFEYALNVAFEINKRKLWNKAELFWLTNEYEVGDFGMGGAFVKRGGYVTSTKVFAESVLSEYGIQWIKRAAVTSVEDKIIHYETLDGEKHTLNFDFAMLIPGFAGSGIKAFDKEENDITLNLFNEAGFMKVDADYTPRPYEEWSAKDWPSTYQSPAYSNIFASGIAFAPPHAISKPFINPNGTAIAPAPPRTGMPSGVIGNIVASNIAESINNGAITLKHKASMARMGAACIISAGYGIRNGSGASMTVFPIVPDFEKYPEWGRNINYTVGEQGLAGHWIKLLLHYMFIYKAKAKPFWWLIPD